MITLPYLRVITRQARLMGTATGMNNLALNQPGQVTEIVFLDLEDACFLDPLSSRQQTGYFLPFVVNNNPAFPSLE
jgi:hypothetical protein